MNRTPVKRDYPDRPLIGVGAVIVDAGRAVIVRRAHEPLKGEWSIPGGVLEIGETLRGGAAREALEVTGLVVEPGGHQVTHVLLQQGHMRGRKEVAIPISAVTKIGTLLIHLSLTRHQVKDLPPVHIDQPAG